MNTGRLQVILTTMQEAVDLGLQRSMIPATTARIATTTDIPKQHLPGQGLLTVIVITTQRTRTNMPVVLRGG